MIIRDEVLAKVMIELKKSQERMHRDYDEGKQVVSFEVGDYV